MSRALLFRGTEADSCAPLTDAERDALFERIEADIQLLRMQRRALIAGWIFTLCAASMVLGWWLA